MKKEDEKRALDALMDELDSGSEDSSENEAQVKVGISAGVRQMSKDYASSHLEADAKHQYRGNNSIDVKEFTAKDEKLVSQDASSAELKPAPSSTPTRPPPKPARKSISKKDTSDAEEERIIEVSREPLKSAHSKPQPIPEISSPEFRARYSNRAAWSDSEDDEVLGEKRFVLRKSSEGIPDLMHSLTNQARNRTGSLSSSLDGAFPSEPSKSDKMRLSEIDSFGASFSHISSSSGSLLFENNGKAEGDARGSSSSLRSESNLAGSAAAATQANTETTDAAKRWLYRACTKGARPLQCYVEREPGSFTSMYPTFRMYLEQNQYTEQNARFMMSAKKMRGKSTSYYLVSLDLTPTDDRGSDSVVGRVRGNAVGSEYVITDGGVTAGKTRISHLVRKELGFVKFDFDSKRPSATNAWIPTVTDGGLAAVWQPETPEDGMDAKIKAGKTEELVLLKNKIPKWDAAYGGHVLCFHGRVTESSVKNFQLVAAEESENPNSTADDDVILQFGKVEKNRFTLDFTWPLSPMQAFCICVASLDGKLADRKGYDFIRNTKNYIFGTKDK